MDPAGGTLEQEHTDRQVAVIEAAREFKKHMIALSAKEIGTHDPDLPTTGVSGRAAAGACLSLLRALTALDGPVAHEQPAIALLQGSFDDDSQWEDF